MNEPNVFDELAALRAAALEDLMVTSDAELRREAAEDGQDAARIAVDVKAALREAAATSLRKRLVQSRQRIDAGSPYRAVDIVRPAVDRLKQLVREAFANDPSLGLAFRDGKRQSDADWVSLYDDLVSLGKINTEPDAD
jgi:hypothetical protein